MPQADPKFGDDRTGHLIDVLVALTSGRLDDALARIWRDAELVSAVLGLAPPESAMSRDGHEEPSDRVHDGARAGSDSPAADTLADRFGRACGACDAFTLQLLVAQLLRHALEAGDVVGDASWHATQVRAELVAALAASHGDAAAPSFGIQCVLAAHGVNEASLYHPSPLWLDDIREFATAPTDQLHDAHPLVRYVHIAELARSAGVDHAAQAVRSLFGIDGADLPDLLAGANARADAVAESARQRRAGTDTPRLLDALRVIDGARALLADAPTPEDVLARGAAILDRVDGGALEYLAFDPDRGLLCGLPGSATAQLAVHTDVVRSRVARCFDERVPARIPSNADDLAVVDRQLIRLLGGSAVQGVPVTAYPDGDCYGLLLAGAPGADDPVGGLDTALVLGELAHWLARAVREDRRRRKIEADYLAANERRLREVVHEANNPLSIVHNYLHILGLRLKDEDAGREQLRMIGEEIRRTGDIIRSLLEVPMAVSSGAGAAPEHAELDVNRLLTDLVGMLDAALLAPAGVDVTLDLDPESIPLRIDADKLKQVLSNLIRNAVEAMPDGGRLSLSTQFNVMNADRLCVEIQIHDSGPGLEPEVFERLFEPKQTRKAGQHEGLGLHIVRQLMEEIGGSISCQTRRGAGTRFQLLIPRDSA